VAPAMLDPMARAFQLKDRPIEAPKAVSPGKSGSDYADPVAEGKICPTNVVALLGNTEAVVHRLRVGNRNVMGRLARLDRTVHFGKNFSDGH